MCCSDQVLQFKITCYKMNQYIYSWNVLTKKCIVCGAGSSSNNYSKSVNKSVDNTANSATNNNQSSLQQN
ncbi:unnamed protein product (macronuclear) [Paramecium tetraurelia]|uniref:Uncharacterized protein n=1 Tax=Paramecium tetraurelia TaxID=5888 RepID=A0CUW1_PARTE|nr:uncharacterized protein GSPATT00039033001 [Paramecium tetraurelia]CAK74578.1 unnamed protein product [Paramecium tetraurelia]|eukprot:XP_001441975.1 hypothetical protein (macronuclear) [Paramecium tetraurelia strain d4-2]